MRKFFPYILIFVIAANLFAPFSVGVNKNNTLSLKTSVAEAALFDGVNIEFTVLRIENGNNAVFKTEITWTEVDKTASGETLDEEVTLYIRDKAPNTIQEFPLEKKGRVRNGKTDTYTTTINKLIPEHAYAAYLLIKQNKISGSSTKINKLGFTPDVDFNTTKWGSSSQQVDTSVNNSGSNQASADDIMPACSMNPFSTGDGTFIGCMAQLFYYAAFVPTSFLFGLTGKFFDWTFAYSISDASYRASFVTEGWGILRDICNIFFIFILLYAAFGMILNIRSIKYKEIVVNVIIIGLLINFSLFATQVIIDASNILARVFYSSQAIEIKVGESGGLSSRGGIDNTANSGIGELGLSAALVDKINPQEIIINSKKVTITDDATGDTGTSENKGEIGVGAFFLITLMAVIVNVIGLFVFLSVGLIFVSRVIGLWLAMVFAPLAFFTYTVPSFSKAKFIGWTNWWSDLLRLCFVAPIFMFFLYLIILFLDTAFSGVVNNSTLTGANWVLSVIIPFVFVMVLLMTAKKLAKEYSGSIGATVTSAVTAVGGVALGAGIGAAALAGRATIGRVANRFGNSDRLNNLASGKDAQGNEIKSRNFFTNMRQKAAIAAKKTTTTGSKGTFDLRQTGAANLLSSQTGLNLNKYTNFAGLDTKRGLGGYAGSQARKIEKEEKFAKTLGFDHHSYEHAQDDIAKREGELNAEKRERTAIEGERNIVRDNNPGEKASKAEKSAYQARLKTINDKLAQKNSKIYEMENGDGKEGRMIGLEKMKKEAERIKEGREKEYYQYKRNQSGRIIKEDALRDSKGNISKFATYEQGKTSAKQFMKEFAEGFAKGASAGAGALAVPALLGGVAAPAVWGVGTVAGGLIGGVRQSVFKYSGTTNIKIGSGHNHVEKHEDNYKEPKEASGGSHDSGHAEHSEEHHDEHAGGGHGH